MSAGESYGDIIDRHALDPGDWVLTPGDGDRQIVGIRSSPGDDAGNPDADIVTVDNGVEYFREELRPV